MGNLIKNKNLRRIVVMLIIAVTVIAIPLSTMTIKASAYTGSWIQGTDEYDNLYGGTTSVPDNSEPVTSASGAVMDWLGEQIGTLIYNICLSFFHFMTNATGAGSTAINQFTVEGIVLGKVILPAGTPNVFGFDLTAGNYYGIVGASVYSILRGFAYSGIFIMFLFLLAKNLFDNSPKAKDDLKESVSGSIIALVMMGIMPQITELVLFTRDSVLLKVATMMRTSTGASGNLITSIIGLYHDGDSNRLVASILLAALLGGIIFYGKDYISIALQQTILFAFFPVFNVLGTNKKKFLSDWANTFFSNMAVPLIDVIILWLPYSVLANITANNASLTMVEGLVIVMMVWSARQVRQEILKMFGNLTNSPVGKGLGGLGQMVQLAKMGAMMGQRAAGAVAGVAMSAASSASGYGEFSNEANSAALDSTSMSNASADIMKSDIGVGADDMDALNNRDMTATPNIEEDLRQNFGTGSVDSDLPDTENTNTEMADADIEAGESISGVNEMEDIDGEMSDGVIEEGIDSEAYTESGEALYSEGSDIVAGAENVETASDSSNESVTAITPMPTGIETVNSEMPEENVSEKPTMPEGLNKFDTDRWNNLNALDNANENLSKAQSAASISNQNLARFDAGEKVGNIADDDKFSKNVEEHRNRLADIDRRIADHETTHSQNRTLDSYDYNKGKRALETEREDAVRELNNDRAKLVQDKVRAEDRVANAQSRVDAYAQREQKFADVSAQYGMSRRTYEGTGEMNSAIKDRDMRIEAMRQKAKSMGIKKEDLRGLTPEARQELADMQRKNIRSKEIRSLIHKGGEHVVTTAVSGAVKTAGALVGAAAFAYGGEEASMAGVQVGSYIGQTAYNKTAGRVVRATHYAVNNADLLLGIQSPPATGNTVNKGAGGRTKVSTKPTQPKQTKSNKPVEQKKTENASPKAANVSATSEAGSRASKGIKLDK